ncbi:gamma-glutamylcyclotransferase family protein [Sphingobium sp. CR28]|uniref:gamma-glutamylcyclotransferase family protein n=1 Tax=Sphingobium sp. CR28 TaxID=3400272 RepID=UPI003FF0F030
MDDPAALPFFFYGTLMRGESSHAALSLPDWTRYLGPASVRGLLYNLGDWPCAVPGPEGVIQGELHRLVDPSRISDLDAFEDYDPLDRARSEYIRVAMPLVGGSGPVWVYAYNRPVSGLPRIASGDWRKR